MLAHDIWLSNFASNISRCVFSFPLSSLVLRWRCLSAVFTAFAASAKSRRPNAKRAPVWPPFIAPRLISRDASNGRVEENRRRRDAIGGRRRAGGQRVLQRSPIGAKASSSLSLYLMRCDQCALYTSWRVSGGLQKTVAHITAVRCRWRSNFKKVRWQMNTRTERKAPIKAADK